MEQENCVFCKIVSGEIPSSTIYEDNDFKVILDISPATKGHAIIIPKNHAKNVFELSEEDASKVFVVAKKVATAMKEALKCDGFNILQNNEEVAGQTVFHFHMHLIPRYKEDKVTIKWCDEHYVGEDIGIIAEKIKKCL
ncbi:HIT family protein [Anaeromicropila herbilytica]|uniref:Protein hit n=1 Tax=Anaeromicropila herbilytica TaxID=2785025 RepID=A0A7R7EQ21_9FIRM|nr:HIT family protein [Anaeromicropila herbilytica]BCN32923.1 protein hit [Anaeromicropila herbilytica]